MEVFGFHTVEAENSEEVSSVPQLPRKDFKNARCCNLYMTVQFLQDGNPQRKENTFNFCLNLASYAPPTASNIP